MASFDLELSIACVGAGSAVNHHVDVASEEALVPLAAHLDAGILTSPMAASEVIPEGEDVSGEIRTQEVANAASQVAVAFPRVREALLRRQRAFREAPGLIADGRDMGTVFPDAPVKITLTPPWKNVAQRRMLQLQRRGLVLTLIAFYPR